MKRKEGQSKKLVTQPRHYTWQSFKIKNKNLYTVLIYCSLHSQPLLEIFSTFSQDHINKQKEKEIHVRMHDYLEVNNYSKDKDSGNEVGKIWQILTIEGFTQTTHFICSGGQQMEESNDCSFKFSS